MKVILWGGPLDGQQLEVEVPADANPLLRLLLPDPSSLGNKVIYEQTSQMKGERFIFRILQEAGC
jgi:hypothetical protein